MPAFLQWLVARNYVTDYQATLLARGHVDDFFLGEYKILERIGRGRMAGVYKAVRATRGVFQALPGTSRMGQMAKPGAVIPRALRSRLKRVFALPLRLGVPMPIAAIQAPTLKRRPKSS